MVHSQRQMETDQPTNRTENPSVAGRMVIQPINPEQVAHELAETNSAMERARADRRGTTSHSVNGVPSPDATLSVIPVPIEMPNADMSYATMRASAGPSSEAARPTNAVSQVWIRRYGVVALIASIVMLVYAGGNIAKWPELLASSGFNGGFFADIGMLVWGIGCFFSATGLLQLRRWGCSLLISTFIISGLLLLPFLPLLLLMAVFSFFAIFTAPMVALFMVTVPLTLVGAFVFIFPKSTKEQLT